MDVLVLIDKLDELVHNAKAVPLTDQVRIDREEIWEILDQMRATIPDEIKQARWIVKERQVDVFRPAVKAGAWVVLVAAVLVGITGDMDMKIMVQQQPMKVAAAEALYTTQENAPFSILTVGLQIFLQASDGDGKPLIGNGPIHD